MKLLFKMIFFKNLIRDIIISLILFYLETQLPPFKIDEIINNNYKPINK